MQWSRGWATGMCSHWIKFVARLPCREGYVQRMHEFDVAIRSKGTILMKRRSDTLADETLALIVRTHRVLVGYGEGVTGAALLDVIQSGGSRTLPYTQESAACNRVSSQIRLHVIAFLFGRILVRIRSESVV